MALKSLYRVCEILKLDLIFSSFSVRSQNKNSIGFRLARHLCSSTSLVTITSFFSIINNPWMSREGVRVVTQVLQMSSAYVAVFFAITVIGGKLMPNKNIVG